MKPWTRTLCLLLLVSGFLLATTYPYTLLVNHARLSDGPAVFERPGIVLWPGLTISPDTQRLVVRLGLTPYRSDQEGPARIFTISRDHHHSNVTIGQEGSDLIVRLRRGGTDPLGRPAFTVPGVFDSLDTRMIDVALDRNSLLVKVNGEKALSATLEGNPFRFWDPGYALALGNEHTWQRPWLGEVREARLTVDGDDHDLLRGDSAYLPGFRYLLRQKLDWVSVSLVDNALNFFFMIPIGALTALCLRRRRIALTLGLWLGLATGAEITQALIPDRYPAISDLLLNGMGAGVGAWLLVRFHGPGRQPRAGQAGHPGQT